MAVILVVDDDENNRALIKAIVPHYGHTVLEAEDGELALAVCATEHVDLVLLDLALPKMDGSEVVRALRKDARTRDLRVALYTATRATPALRDFMSMYGIRELIAKPSEPQELLLAIQRALRQ